MTQSKTKNILVIDDDALVHMSFSMALFGSNYNKISIQDVQEALKYSESKEKYDKPDLILVDLMLGNFEGTDIIKIMRKDQYFDNIPIILHSGYVEQISGTRVIKDLNILYVLPKPCTKQELLKCIDTYMDYFGDKTTSAI